MARQLKSGKLEPMKRSAAKQKAPDINSYLKVQSQKVGKLFREVQDEPSGESVHQLRVTLRKIRTVLQIINQSKIKTLKVDESKKLSRVWKALGKQRDLDVAIRNAESLHLDSTQLRTLCQPTRKKTASRLKNKSVNLIIKSLERINRQLGKHPINPERAIYRLIEDLQHNFEAPEEIHHLRILLKRVRYLLESLSLPTTEFKPFQDVLGNLNDYETLLILFGRNTMIEEKRKLQLKSAKAMVPEAKRVALMRLKASLSTLKTPATK